jgi:hypothetical protein
MVARLKASIRAYPERWGWVLNAAFCTVVGAVLSLAMTGSLQPAYFTASFSIGFSIHAFITGVALYGPSWLPRWAGETVAAMCGMLLGLALGGVFLDGDPLFLLGSNAFLLIGVLLGGVGLAGSVAVERLWEARNRLARAERDALARDKALAEAELRVLQAQVEPHFLFNTLANVGSLIHTQPDRATWLLERLTSLLRASLSRTRRADGTLGDELAVVRAYLEIQAVRMAGRMTCEVDAHPGLEAVRLPPLLVQPLVENAVLHGIEPSAAGGRVTVRAERAGGEVRILVADDGVGLDPDTARQGVGLANVRERLQATFGARGRLVLSETPGGGVSADLRIPAAPAGETESR